MAHFHFSSSKVPSELRMLCSEDGGLSEKELNELLKAAELHLDQQEAAAAGLFSRVSSRSSCQTEQLTELFSGLLSLLQAARALPPSRRRPPALTVALGQLRVRQCWQPALVETMCRPATPRHSQGHHLPVHWDMDVVITDSERGQVLEPSVGLRMTRRDGDAIYLQFPKAQFVRFRQEMAVVQREMECAQFRHVTRSS